MTISNRKQYPPQEEIQKYFDYKDGYLYWKIRPNSGAPIRPGDRAGHCQQDKYTIVGLNNQNYLAHNLIFCYFQFL